jgi:hypothetical protein
VCGSEEHLAKGRENIVEESYRELPSRTIAANNTHIGKPQDIRRHLVSSLKLLFLGNWVIKEILVSVPDPGSIPGGRVTVTCYTQEHLFESL